MPQLSWVGHIVLIGQMWLVPAPALSFRHNTYVIEGIWPKFLKWIFELKTGIVHLCLTVSVSADDEDISPELKVEREKLRRQQNNARER